MFFNHEHAEYKKWDDCCSVCSVYSVFCNYLSI